MLSKLIAPQSLYRICAVLFIVFAIGHTAGFLTFVAPSAEGREVLSRMHSVQFERDGHFFSYGKFYVGFGLFISAYLIFCAYLAAILGQAAKRNLAMPRGLGWGLVALQLVSLALGIRYFGMPPVVLSLLLTLFLTAAALSSRPTER